MPRSPVRETALWKQVCARPRDAELRLVLAQRLEQEGDPQGELIRLCCTPAPAERAERAVRDARMKQLLAEHGDAWYPPPPRRPSYWNAPSFLDGAGIPDHLYPSFADARAELAWWTRHYPLRRVSLLGHHEWTPVFEALEAGAHFARLESLTLTSAHASRAALTALGGGSPGLEALHLGLLNSFDPPDLATLALGRLLRGVKTLAFEHTAFDSSALEAVWSRLGALEHFRASDTRIDEGAMNLGLRDPPKLRSVIIGGGWDEAHVTALWDGIDPVALKELRVNRVELGDRFLGAVAAAALRGALDALEVLDLGKCSITNVRHLLASLPPNLRVLRLENNAIPEAGMHELTRHPLVGRLRELGISNNDVFTGGYVDQSAYGYDAVVTRQRMEASEMRKHFSVPAHVVVM